ncbi:MAG: diguanylate cyclase [Lysobacterales bacterium]
MQIWRRPPRIAEALRVLGCACAAMVVLTIGVVAAAEKLVARAPEASIPSAADRNAGKNALSTESRLHHSGPPSRLELPSPWRAWRIFSSSDSLPQNLVYSIAQDREGFVYAGLGTGLARYDGRRWQQLLLPGQRGPVAVGAVGVDRQGEVWIGTDGGGVFHRHGGSTVHVPGLEGDAGVIYALLAAGRDSMWAATDGGIALCGARGCTLVEPMRGKSVRSLAYGNSDHGPCLWIGAGGEGVYRIDLGAGRPLRLSALHLTRSDGLPNSYVSSLLQWGGREGRDLWIGTGRGLARFDGQSVVAYSASNGFPGAVNGLIAGRGHDRGLLFAAIKPGGLGVLREDGEWTVLDQAQGLPDSSVQSIAYTTHGSRNPALWIGTSAGGIAREDAGRWHTLDERQGLSARGMAGLGLLHQADDSQVVWVGAGNGAQVATNRGWRALAIPEAIAGLAIHDLQRARDGALWISTVRGLWRVDGKDTTAFTVDNSALPGVFADQILLQSEADASETVWIGTGHGLARWRKSTGLVRIDNHAWLRSNPAVRGLASNSPGEQRRRMWVGNDLGVLENSGDDTWRAVFEHCTAAAAVTVLASHAGALGDELWIGAGERLLRVRGEDCASRNDLFAGGYAQQIAFDARGNAYVFSTAGALRLFADDQRAFADLPVQRFGTGDGIASREFLFGRGSARDARGRVWVAAADAAHVYDPADDAPAGEPSPLVWHATTLGPRMLPLAEGARLPAGTSPLTFAARLLSLQREARIRYRAQLIGLDPSPQPWQSNPVFTYSRLPAGAYEVRVWGRDAQGVVSGPLRLSFSILTPWWVRPWTLAAYAFSLIGIGVLIGYWRAHIARERARELSVQVDARTSELADANRQLETASLTDALTGLNNRRHAAQELPAIQRRAQQRKLAGMPAQCMLVLIDIDHFKRINDQHGHAIGDAVLQIVATRLRAGVRGHDLLVRWGGEEFLLVLLDCDPEQAVARLRLLLHQISDPAFAPAKLDLCVTASAGAVLWSPSAAGEAGSDAIELHIARADRALYQAKDRGRDRAVLVVEGESADGAEPISSWVEVPRLVQHAQQA